MFGRPGVIDSSFHSSPLRGALCASVGAARLGANTRPHAYQTCALPTELLVCGNPGESGLALRGSALAIKLPSLCVVEDRGLKPRSSPCKSDVLSNELIPRRLAGTAGFAPASFRVTAGHSAIELHAIGALGWVCTTAAPGFNRPLY